jgi:ribosome-associated toxin RatA of RatAB toxin-antitoxin module
MKRVARSAIVPHSAAQLYALVEDIESYPRFLPWCVGVEVKSRTRTRQSPARRRHARRKDPSPRRTRTARRMRST